MGDGHEVQDAFNKKKNCIDFKLNKPNTPDCMIGYANRDIIAGETLHSELGKEHWANRDKLQSLGGSQKIDQCIAFYGLVDKDIKE